MSEVSVDPPALDREADAILSEHEAANPQTAAPGDQVAAPDPNQPTPEQLREGYRVLSFAILDRASSALAPAWSVTPEEKGSLSSACADALLLWFPDQPIPPKYMALLVVAGVAMEIVDKRRDPKTGKLAPRVHVEKKPAPAAAPAAAA